MADLQTLLSKFLADLYAGTIGSTAAITGIRNGDGTTGAPSYSFASDPNTGFMWISDGFIAFVSNGTASIDFGSSADPYRLGFGNDVFVTRDGAANILALKNGTSAQTLRLYGTTTGPKYLSISHDGSNGVIDTAASSGLLSIAPTNATSVTIGKAISTLVGVATDGTFGVAPITRVTQASGLTGADTNRVNYTPAAANSTYRISGVVNVTAWTTPASFTIVCTYKDGSGNARTDTAMVWRGSTGATAAAVTAIDRWYYSFPAVDIDTSATAITVSTTGTFTGSPVYNHAVTLERIR